MTPSWLRAVMNALKKHNKVRLYYETAADFTTIDAGAVGEDNKVGIEHFMRPEPFHLGDHRSAVPPRSSPILAIHSLSENIFTHDARSSVS